LGIWDDLAVHAEAGNTAIGIDGQPDVGPASTVLDGVGVGGIAGGGGFLDNGVPFGVEVASSETNGG
jgi:hypothetical protein